MSLPEVTVRLRHPRSFRTIRELDDFTSLTYTKRWTAPGSFTLVVPNSLPKIWQVVGRRVLVEILLDGRQEFVGVTCHRKATIQGATAQWELTGYDLGAYLTFILALPDPAATDAAVTAGQDDDTFTGYASDALRYYVQRNILSPGATKRTPWADRVDALGLGAVYVPDPNLAGQQVDVLGLGSLGTTLTQQARYQPVAKVLSDICAAGNVGYQFRLDTANHRILFDVWGGADRRLDRSQALTTSTSPVKTGWAYPNNFTYRPVVFRQNQDTLGDFEYTDDGFSVVSTVYALGKNLGRDRNLVVRSADAEGWQDALGDYWPPEDEDLRTWGRHEAMLDVQDAADDAALDTAALAKLAQDGDHQSVTFQPSAVAMAGYGRDWLVGDVVTVICETFAIVAAERIQEVTVALAAGQVLGMSVTVGTVPHSVKTQWDLIAEADAATHQLRAWGRITQQPPPTTAAKTIGAVGSTASSQSGSAYGTPATPASPTAPAASGGWSGTPTAVSDPWSAQTIGGTVADPTAALLSDVQTAFANVGTAIGTVAGDATDRTALGAALPAVTLDPAALNTALATFAALVPDKSALAAILATFGGSAVTKASIDTALGALVSAINTLGGDAATVASVQTAVDTRRTETDGVITTLADAGVVAA